MTQDLETDSDDLVMEMDATKPDKKLSSSERTNPSLSAMEMLQEVLIPSPTSKAPSHHGRSIPNSQSSSLDGFASSSGRGQSSEYDTPGTSTVVTPAESLGRRGSLTGMSLKAVRGRPKGQVVQTGVHNKRKHEDILGDALLAQALQEEEYREDKPTRGPAKRRRTVAVEDSEDEDLNLSDVDDIDPIEADHQSTEKKKTGGLLSLPTRAARDSAIKSMKNKHPREIMDTGSEDSELSEYKSDEELGNFEGSDISDEGTSVFGFLARDESDAATATVASNRSAATSAVRRRGRRMAPRATAGRNSGLRGGLPHDSRVSILLPLAHDFQQLNFF